MYLVVFEKHLISPIFEVNVINTLIMRVCRLQPATDTMLEKKNPTSYRLLAVQVSFF
jgi:hypothetical protein